MCPKRTAAHSATALRIFTLLCLLIAAALRAGLDFNGAYLDECDYLFVSRLLYAGESWPTQTYIFSSDLPLYVLGLGEQLGGLLGARSVAAGLGLISLGLYAAVWTRALGRQVGLLSAAVFATQAPHIFISKLATYDIVCFTLFVAALYPLSRPTLRRRDAAAAGLLFAAAVLSKYLVVLFAPLLALWAWRSSRAAVWQFALPLVFVLGAYGVLNHAALTELFAHQVQGVHVANSAPLSVLGLSLRYTAFAALLWILAWNAAVRARATHARAALLWMALGALPIIAFHLNARDEISLYKHMVYPLAFLAPAAGWLLSHAADRLWRPALVITAGMALSCWEVRQMELAFPDNRPVVAAASTLVDTQSLILSENPYLFRYHLHPRLALENFEDIGDATFDGIHRGRYDLVYLDGTLDPERNRGLRSALLSSGYERVISHEYRVSTVLTDRSAGLMELYRRPEPTAYRTGE